MQPQLRALGKWLWNILAASLLGALVWALAVQATTGYQTPTDGIGKAIRDFAVPVSAIVATLTFFFNSRHQRRTLRRQRESVIVEAAVDRLFRGVDLAGEVFGEAGSETLLFQAAPSFQIDTIADLLSSAEAKLQKLSEPELVDRLRVEIAYAGSKLLQLLRFRGTSEFFDFRYYRAAYMASGRRFDLQAGGSTSLAAYHNSSIEILEELQQNCPDLGELDPEVRRDLGHLEYLVDRLRAGSSPFSHPFLGSSIPLESMETILRFSVGKPGPEHDLDEVLEDREVADQWFLGGLYVLLYQAEYFESRSDGRVYNTRESHDG